MRGLTVASFVQKMRLNFDMKHPTTLCTALLSVLLTGSVLNTSNSVMSWWQADALIGIPAPSTHLPHHKAADQQASLLPRLHLFGVAMAEPDHSQPVINPTQLPLHLSGVYQMTGPGAQSEAVIAVANQPARTFREGQALLPGVMLSKVYADHILLSHEGQLESLSIDNGF